mmetsp:Transcript_22594/g.22435  ORF Transcript_22594/g.22435 Transcript_22594/m.22435 type:complete len:211 (+) Transcript_22594:170-802(+)|eukprot:CAMPEP_0197006532 /NCGR_PEP_ID=MMETSP1380-20130617/35509_1 /TAXON_ID=5936 /ORGANISM="Euplotes crassus, Strain CT5" /LENGTH=210 /DNA_ID=CAMNT_0042426149 /DNA_START=170 /DNA_END=802 /DNA_ORIENTATION=+
MTTLKVLAFRGIPEEVKSLRGIVWRLLLNYLPNKATKWIETINENKKQYESFREELIIKPQLSMEGEKSNGPEVTEHVVDHPLSVSQDSVWAQFHKDREIWEEIEKDVKRTRNEIALFVRAIKDEDSAKHWERLMRQAELKKSELNAEDKENYIETHADVLSRILFIHAKLNPGIKYVQGMNEILAVLYFVFFDTDDPILTETLESDLFF